MRNLEASLRGGLRRFRSFPIHRIGFSINDWTRGFFRVTFRASSVRRGPIEPIPRTLGPRSGTWGMTHPGAHMKRFRRQLLSRVDAFFRAAATVAASDPGLRGGLATL